MGEADVLNGTNHADVDVGVYQFDVVGGHNDVGVGDEMQPAAGHRAVQRADHGLPHVMVERRPRDLLARRSHPRRRSASGGCLADINTRAEVPVTRPGNDDGAHCWVVANVGPYLSHHRAHGPRQRVARLRPVEPDGCDMTILGELDHSTRVPAATDLAICLRMISDVPSATQMRRTCCHASARPSSLVNPIAPCTWTALSMMRTAASVEYAFAIASSVRAGSPRSRRRAHSNPIRRAAHSSVAPSASGNDTA